MYTLASVGSSPRKRSNGSFQFPRETIRKRRPAHDRPESTRGLGISTLSSAWNTAPVTPVARYPFSGPVPRPLASREVSHRFSTPHAGHRAPQPLSLRSGPAASVTGLPCPFCPPLTKTPKPLPFLQKICGFISFVLKNLRRCILSRCRRTEALEYWSPRRSAISLVVKP